MISNSIKKKTLDVVYMGPEPIPSGPFYHEKDPRLTTFFNWYNYFYTTKEGREWISKWMKANKYTPKQLATFAKAPDHKIKMTICSLVKMMNNGAQLNDVLTKRITDHIDEVIKSIKPSAVKEKISTVTVADRVRDKAMDILADVEHEFDLLYLNDYFSEFSMYNLLKIADAKPVMGKYIKDAYKKLADEIAAVEAKTDKDLVEGYVNLSKKQLTSYRKFVSMIMSDSDQYFSNRVKTTVRKPTVKKPVNNAALLKTFKYLPEHKELKIVSFPPINIFEATSVWIYNTKYKKLTVLNAEEGKKLSVKGTTIFNFDKTKSVCKTVRKPAETLKAVSDSGKVPLRTFMQTLTTVPSPVTGRISEDVILLKAIK
jgi:hypothetical protein